MADFTEFPGVHPVRLPGGGAGYVPAWEGNQVEEVTPATWLGKLQWAKEMIKDVKYGLRQDAAKLLEFNERMSCRLRTGVDLLQDALDLIEKATSQELDESLRRSEETTGAIISGILAGTDLAERKVELT